MLLSSFQVRNYRSISKADIPLSKVTVLLGKNNEGKSNILRALTTAMSILEVHSGKRPSILDERDYKWTRDYPKILQRGVKTRLEDRVTVFTLKFVFDETEVANFRKEIGNNINGELPIEIRIGPDNKPQIRAVKRGPGSKSLNLNRQHITAYISKRISCNYIAAIRTDEDSYQVIDRLVQREFEKLKDEKKYQDALHIIEDLQKPILESISQNIQNVLRAFLPEIRAVTVNAVDRRSARYRYYNSEIIINDGQETDLEEKGDGVKSLVTLGLLQNHWIEGGASIVAIEEPESHLHPEAINRLRETIYGLAQNNQVVITTHNPLFVNRNDLQSNIIVNDGEARVANSVRSIRDILGVKISDNLFNANLSIFVEGDSDKNALSAILSKKSRVIKRAIDNHILVFLSLHGVKNLGYYVNMFRSLVASFYCVLDSDAAAQQVINHMLSEKTLFTNEYTCFILPGHNKGAELEDLYDTSVYSQFLLDKYGIDVTCGFFKRRDLKWSDKVEALFSSAGKVYSKELELEIKNSIASIVVESQGDVALVPEAEQIISHIKDIVEGLISA